METRLTCTCGKESVEVNSSGITVGDISSRTKFIPILSYTGEVTWLCRDCYMRVHALSLEILKIVRDENLYFPSLLMERLPYAVGHGGGL